MNAKKKNKPAGPVRNESSENVGIQVLSIGFVTFVTLAVAGLIIECFCLPFIIFYAILGVILLLGVGYLIQYLKAG